MPTLLEVQQAMSRSLLGAAGAASEADVNEAAALSPVPGLAAVALGRLSVYRNTLRRTLVNALRLSFPAIQRLVGEEFFEGAAQRFIDQPVGIPQSAWLNEYGGKFAAFLASFRPAAALPYLADVARLEWAINQALHAPEAARLDAAQLASRISGHTDVRFVPHPSIGLLYLRFPADTIWRAVLEEDDAALSAIDLSSGPVWLLVERTGTGVQTQRLTQDAWRLTEQLCAGLPLYAALETNSAETPDSAAVLLAEQLSSGRFIDALLAGDDSDSAASAHPASGDCTDLNYPSGDSIS